LNHPGIVRIYDFDSDAGSLFIVMELVEGHSLRYWLSESGRFKVDVSLDLIQQALSAVGAAHQHGVVHRDLKPDNILVTTQGKTKILDFGISRVVTEAHRLTATGSMVGTPAYMSPEQVRGDEVDHRADIYALGCILYELMHGDPPFVGSIPSILHAHVFEQPRPSTAIPEKFMQIIYKAMAKDREQRFQSCEEFSGALLHAARPDLATASAPPQRAARARRHRRHHPRDQAPARHRRPRAAPGLAGGGGRRPRHHRADPAPLPPPPGRQAGLRPHHAPDLGEPGRGGLGTELG